MRFAAECGNVAAGVRTLGLRAHFLRMASVWEELADQPAIGINPLLGPNHMDV
jgi:hypothetical protein